MHDHIKPGDRISGTLTSLEHGGYACLKYQDALLYVDRGVPGDTVSLRVKKLRKNFGSAEIIDILRPSGHRIKPHCEAFLAGCGGCQWLHIDYQSQLVWKRKILRKFFNRMLKTDFQTQPVIGMKNPVACRNKLSLLRGPDGSFGLMKENSKELVTLKSCPQEMPVIQGIYGKLMRSSLPPAVTQLNLRGTHRSGCSLVMFAEHNDPEFLKTAHRLREKIPGLNAIGLKTHGDYVHLAGPKSLEEAIGRLKYHIPVNAFFQTNYEQASVLQNTARRFLNLKASETLLDCYSGVGFFALELAPFVSRVIGIESNRESVDAARLNAALNRIQNTEFRHASVARGLKEFKAGTIDALILDPPRLGCKEALAEIARLKPARIVYFSCVPDALAVDCAYLFQHGYRLTDCVPVDMFPQTWHLEIAIKLVAV